MQNNGFVEVELVRIIIDETRPEQVVVLKEKKGARTFPILIGANEAAAIKMEVSNMRPQRPLTHDLLKETIGSLCASLEKVIIEDLKKNTFYAKMHLKNEKNEPVIIDARPSDCIAMALKMKSPIFVNEKVFDKVKGKENGLA